jgi:hypothetical protein
MSTVITLAGLLAGPPHNFERLASAPPPSGFCQTLTRTDGGRRIMAVLSGADPGTPGHESRFSVVTATVFSVA